MHTNVWATVTDASKLEAGGLYFKEKIVNIDPRMIPERDINILWNKTVEKLKKEEVDLCCFKCKFGEEERHALLRKS